MKLLIAPTLLLAALFLCSCSNSNSKIVGNWEATFNDPLKNPIQYLEIKKIQSKLTISIDEPAEDWYDIQGEKLYFQNDSLHFEKFWGLEKYDGKFLPGDSIITGIKQIQNKQPILFSIRKISIDKLDFKLPRADSNNKSFRQYTYNKPTQDSDSFLCSTLDDVGIKFQL